MNYYINNEEVKKYEFQEALLEEIKGACEEDFDTMLDELHGEINIVGIYYNASYVLEQIDPIAYQQEFISYVDHIYQDKMYDLECEREVIINNQRFEMK